MIVILMAIGREPTVESHADFSSLSSTAERSRAIFNDIGKVITNPRIATRTAAV